MSNIARAAPGFSAAQKAQPANVFVNTPQTAGTVNTLFSQLLRRELLVA